MTCINSGTGAPLCATYSYPNSVTELRCEQTPPTELQVEYTYAGFTTPIFLPRVIPGIVGATAPGTFTTISVLTQTPPPTMSSPPPTSAPSNVSSSTILAQLTAASSTNPAQGTTFSSSANNTPSSSNHPRAGIAAGVAVGGVLLLSGIGFLIFFMRKKYKKTPHLVDADKDLPGYELDISTSHILSNGKDSYTYQTRAELPGRPRMYDTRPVELQA